jgi:hypothetical protein
MDWMNTLKAWIGGLTEVALMLVALGIAVSLLYGGAQLPFFGNITKNLLDLVAALGKEGLAGLIALGVILYLFSHRKVA